ncbi:MAG: hypothetical protein K8T20_19430 [Planctomycetes bacterium]|nr:hypothetical protein [Planctomycetota bacterium]
MDTAFANKLADRFEAFIVKTGGVSFVELTRQVKEGEPSLKGDHAVTVDMPKGGYIVLWAGVSEEFVAAVKTMMARKNVEAKPTQIMVYVADGAVPNYPVIKRMPKGPVSKPKWLPVVFNPTGGRPKK